MEKGWMTAPASSVQASMTTGRLTRQTYDRPSQDKVAIITGGGTGIGKVTAVIFAREGAKVAICGRTLKTIAETARQVHTEGGDIIALECDVSDSGSVQNLVAQTVQHFGQVDILVNSAGVRGSICTVLELSEEEWQRTIDIDAKGSWLCSKFVIPEMQKAGGGSIIMISSVSAHVGQRKHGVYNAAKDAFTQIALFIGRPILCERSRRNR